MIIYDGTDQTPVEIANSVQDLSDYSGKPITVVVEGNTILCSIPHTTTAQTLIAQLRHLLGDFEEGEE